MEQLNIAADNYCKSTHNLLYKSIQDSFKAGAEWQKEQYKFLIAALIELDKCLANADERPYEREIIRQAIEKSNK